MKMKLREEDEDEVGEESREWDEEGDRRREKDEVKERNKGRLKEGVREARVREGWVERKWE